MAIQRSQQKSDLQRKLKTLEYQLYGKNEKLDVRKRKLENEVGNLNLDQTSNFQPLSPSSNPQHPTSSSELFYLKQDLTKIALLASLAVGVQIVLYLSNILNKVKLF